jgi:hypothetical protein
MEVHSLDGSLFFPSLGVLIKSDLNHFDTLAMADQVHYASEGLNNKGSFQKAKNQKLRSCMKMQWHLT